MPRFVHIAGGIIHAELVRWATISIKAHSHDVTCRYDFTDNHCVTTKHDSLAQAEHEMFLVTGVHAVNNTNDRKKTN